MHKLVTKIVRYCSKIDNSNVMDTAYSVFKFGKTSVSISQHLIHPQPDKIQTYSNYYIHHNLCSRLDPQFATSCVPLPANITPENKQAAPSINKVFRVIIDADIGQKQINLDINSLRKNKIIDQLVILHQSNKYATKSQRIIIDDAVQDSTDPEIDMKTRLTKNMQEVEKLLQTGFNLPVAYMISNKNVGSTNWTEVLKTKNKALHSNIVEKLGHKSEAHPSLQHYLFNHGFRVNHLFLRPYKDGQPTHRLVDANNFDIKELVNVLNIINFQGKIAIDNNQHFNENVMFLEQALKNGKFLKHNIYNSEGLMWYLFI